MNTRIWQVELAGRLIVVVGGGKVELSRFIWDYETVVGFLRLQNTCENIDKSTISLIRFMANSTRFHGRYWTQDATMYSSIP